MSAWGWLLQRITAGLVFILLATHLWLLHYVYLGERISFERVAERLSSPPLLAAEAMLLAAAIYHALYGLRGIAIDYRWGNPQAWTWSLATVGVAGFVLGSYSLYGFVR
ncbi:MAG: hypothetical protein V3U31_06540 [Dehalococcoidia bacterium]